MSLNTIYSTLTWLTNNSATQISELPAGWLVGWSVFHGTFSTNKLCYRSMKYIT